MAARRYIAGFYMKVYIIIFVGLLWGVQNFPTDLLVLYSGALFFSQLLVIAVRNQRLFPNMAIQFALSVCKFLFCVC